MNDWISVKDRLPEKYTLCLVFDPENHMIDVGDYLGNRREGSDGLVMTVSHWMPLPKSPEVEA